MPIHVALYRSLSRAARKLDSVELVKALLVARPQKLWDRDGGKEINIKIDEVNRLLWEFNEGEFYKPTGKKVRSIVQKYFRESEEVDLPLAFEAVRRLNDALHMGDALTKKESFEEISYSESLSPLKLIDPKDVNTGSVLLTHPVSCIRQETFHRCVIALCDTPMKAMYEQLDEKNEEDFEIEFPPNERSIFGLILNKPMNVSLKDLVRPNYHDTFKYFLDHQLFLGGVVGNIPLSVVHQYPDIPNSLPLTKGDGESYYFSFLNDSNKIPLINEKIEKGDAKPEDFRFFYFYSAWAPEQLQIELERNVWFPIEGNNIMSECFNLFEKEQPRLDEEANKDEEIHEENAHKRIVTKQQNEEFNQYSSDVWQTMLGSLGEAYDDMSKFPHLRNQEFEARLLDFLDGHYNSIEELIIEE